MGALVACGSVEPSLELVDGGAEGAAAPSSPQVAFTDVDLDGGHVRGMLRVVRASDENPATAYEILLEGIDAPIATLPATGRDITYELDAKSPVGAKLGVRALLGGRRSQPTWTEGDEYVRVLAIPATPGVYSATFDDLGRLYAYDDNGLLRMDGSKVESIPTTFKRPSAAVFDPIERRIVVVWPGSSSLVLSSETLDAADPRFASGLWDPSPSTAPLTLDGKGYVWVGGRGFRCKLSDLSCQAWTSAKQGRWSGMVTDAAKDRMFAFAPPPQPNLECALDGTGCDPWTSSFPSYDRPAAYAPEHHAVLTLLMLPAGGAVVCDLVARSCVQRFFAPGGPWAETLALAWDAVHDRVWALLRIDNTTTAVARVTLDGSVDAVFRVTSSSDPGRIVTTMVDPARSEVHFVTWHAHFIFHSF